MEAIGAVCDPDGDGGPAFARRASTLRDGYGDEIGAAVADARMADPGDMRIAESAGLFAHVRATVAGLEASLPGFPADPRPSG